MTNKPGDIKDVMKSPEEIKERIKELEKDIKEYKAISTPNNKWTYEIMFLTRDIMALKWVLTTTK